LEIPFLTSTGSSFTYIDAVQLVIFSKYVETAARYSSAPAVNIFLYHTAFEELQKKSVIPAISYW